MSFDFEEGKASDPVDVWVGGRIKLARMMKRVAQKDLARAIGITYQTLSKMENGVQRVTPPRLVEFSTVLDVPVGFFFDGMPGTVTADQSNVSARMQSITVDMLELIDTINAMPPDAKSIIKQLVGFLAAQRITPDGGENGEVRRRDIRRGS